MPNRLRFETLESRLLLAADWQQDVRVRDVSSDGFVTPLDALLGINRLNEFQSSALPDRELDSTEPFYDVNGDDFHTPIDVLLVINALNSGPLLSADIAQDTGLGAGADEDRLTFDAGIEGRVEGSAARIVARLVTEGGEEWIDVSSHLDAANGLEISAAEMDLLFGSLSDDQHTVQLSAFASDFDPLPDTIEIEFELDRTPPTAHFYTEITMQSSDQIEIPLLEAVTEESINVSRIRLYDITWGEKAGDPNWGTDGNHPRFELSPESVTLDADGRTLVVEPPPNVRPIKYLIEVDRGGVEDAAGNDFLPGESLTGAYRANFFPSAASQLAFGNTFRNNVQGLARVSEFQFSLNEPENLLWSGNQWFGSLTRYEIYRNGAHLRTLHPEEVVTEPSDANQPLFIPLGAGDYRFRIVEPPASASALRIYKQSDLPNLPENRSSGNFDTQWSMDAFLASMEAGERIYFQHLDDSDSPVVQSVFDPYGRRLEIESGAGMDQFFEAPYDGDYVLQLNRVGYRRFQTATGLRSADVGEVVEGTLQIPGQRERIHFSLNTGRKYLLSVELLDSGLGFDAELPTNGRYDIDHFNPAFIASSSEGYVDIELSDISLGADYRFRVEELNPVEPIFGVGLTALDPGEIRAFRIPVDVSRVAFLGEQEALFIEDEQDSIHTESSWQSERSEVEVFNRSVLLVVRGTDSTSDWRLERTEIANRSLVLGVETEVEFVTGLEHFEFELEADANDFFHFQLLSGDSGSIHYSIVNEAGIGLPRVDGNYDLLRAEFPGFYRLILEPNSLEAGRKLRFQLDSTSSWPVLAVGDQLTVIPFEEQFFTIPNLDRLYLDTLSVGAGSGWDIYDSQGRLAFNQLASPYSSNEVRDLDRETESGERYFGYAEARTANPYTEFVFQRLEPVSTSTPLEMSVPLSGVLSGKGDRTDLSVSLQRGQQVRLEELQIDPEFISIDWVSPAYATNHFPTVRDEPWVAPFTGTYTLRLQNRSADPQQYSIKVSEGTLSELGGGLIGFDVVHSGTLVPTDLGHGRDLISISVEANTAFVVDWLDEGTFDIKYRVLDSHGQPISEHYGFDSIAFNNPDGLILIPDAGDYEIELITQGTRDPQDFRFRLLDASKAVGLNLNEVNSYALPSFESRLFQLELQSASDLFIDAQYNNQGSPILHSVTCTQTGLTFAAGTCIVSIQNRFEEESSTDFAISDRGFLNSLLLNEPKSVQLLEDRSNYFKFETLMPGQTIAVRLPEELDRRVEMYVYDAFGNLVPAAIGNTSNGEGRVFELALAGNYHLQVEARAFAEPQDTELEIATVGLTQTNYTIGDSVSDAMAFRGDVNEYSFSIAMEMEALFVFGEISNAELFNSNGQRIELQDAVTSSEFSVRFLPAGTYSLRSTASHDDSSVRFQILDLAKAISVAEGQHEGLFLEGETLARLYLAETATNALKFSPENSDASFSSFVPILGPSNIGNAWVLQPGKPQYLVVQPGDSRSYSFELWNDIPMQSSGSLGVPFDGTVSTPHVTHDFVFSLLGESSIHVRNQTTGLTTELLVNDGSALPVGSGGSTVFSKLETGEVRLRYKAGNLGSSESYYYGVATAFEDAQELFFDRDQTVLSQSAYRISVLDPIVVRTSIHSSETGRASLQFYSTDGERIRGDAEHALEPGEYWIVPEFENGSAQNEQPDSVALELRLDTIRRTETESELGAEILVDLNTDELDERLVRISVAAGEFVSLSKLFVADSTEVRYRIAPNTLWRPIETLNNFLAIETRTILEVLFTGSGRSQVIVDSLFVSPELPHGSSSTQMLVNDTRKTWRLPAGKVRSLAITTNAPDLGLNWAIVDATSQTIELSRRGIEFSIVGDQELFLTIFGDLEVESELLIHLESTT